jgi:hypothetical protein
MTEITCDADDCKYCSKDFICTRKTLSVDVDCICGCWEENIQEEDE